WPPRPRPRSRRSGSTSTARRSSSPSRERRTRISSSNARADVRMRGFPGRMDVDEAVRIVRELARPLDPEPVDLGEAVGRVLADDVVAPRPVPGFARAAMDGYAVRGEETFGASDYNPLTFRLLGEAMPGRPYGGTVEPGHAVRIMTGAPVPA